MYSVSCINFEATFVCAALTYWCSLSRLTVSDCNSMLDNGHQILVQCFRSLVPIGGDGCNQRAYAFRGYAQELGCKDDGLREL